MSNSLLTSQIGQRIFLPGHFDGPVVLEDARPLGSIDSAGYECRVRLPDGSLEEAIISAEEVAAVLGKGPGEAKTETPVDAEKLRLLIESARVRLAYAHDQQFAVSLSGIRTLPHQIVACRRGLLQTRIQTDCGRGPEVRGRASARPTGAPRPKQVRFEVVEATSEHRLGFDPAVGSKGGNATCPFCGTVADSDYVKAEGCTGRMSQQMMAIAATRPGSSGKVYLSADDLVDFVPDDSDIRSRIAKRCEDTGLSIPDEAVVNDAKNANFSILYGLITFGDFFTPRQTLAPFSLCAATRSAEGVMRRSKYQEERVIALPTFLAAVIDRLADFNSNLCVFNYTGGRGVVHAFGRQALPMVWDFAESNVFNPDGASWVSGIEDVPAGLRDANMPLPAIVGRGSATALPWPDGVFDAVATDPPYYDNVPYANISDYFYVWLRRSVGHLYPEHFASDGTPKKKEAVADAVRYDGDRARANAAYEQMMAQSFSEASRVLKPGGQLTVVYAHKTTLGWSTLVDALRRAGFIVKEAWPLDTEKPGRLRAQESAGRDRVGGRTGWKPVPPTHGDDHPCRSGSAQETRRQLAGSHRCTAFGYRCENGPAENVSMINGKRSCGDLTG